jgi:hypothetical protein
MTVEGIAADYTNPLSVHTNPIPVHTNPAPVHTNPIPVHTNPTPVHTNPTPVHTNPTPVLPSPLRGRRSQNDHPIYSYVIVKVLAVRIAMGFRGLTSGEDKEAVTMDEDSGVFLCGYFLYLCLIDCSTFYIG